jgi:hypothetical protein
MGQCLSSISLCKSKKKETNYNHNNNSNISISNRSRSGPETLQQWFKKVNKISVASDSRVGMVGGGLGGRNGGTTVHLFDFNGEV